MTYHPGLKGFEPIKNVTLDPIHPLISDAHRDILAVSSKAEAVPFCRVQQGDGPTATDTEAACEGHEAFLNHAIGTRLVLQGRKSDPSSRTGSQADKPAHTHRKKVGGHKRPPWPPTWDRSWKRQSLDCPSQRRMMESIHTSS